MRRSPRVPPGVTPAAALTRSLAEFAASVVRLGDVDAVTTELVRLRCASHHDCHT